MLHTPSHLRTVKVPQVASDDNPYHLLVAAILARAVADAEGVTFAPGTQSPDHIVTEARQWLAAEDGPRNLIELCGYDADVVLRRVRQCLQAPLSVVAAPQLTLL